MDLRPPAEDGLAPAKVLSAAADGAADLFRRNGGDIDTIFGNSGVRVSDLGDPVAEINLTQYCDLFEIAATKTGNDNIGLNFGHDFQPRQLGMLGYAAISSPTLSAALQVMEQLFPAHQEQSSFGILNDDGILWLCYRILDHRIQKKRQDAELSLGMFCNIFKAALGPDWSPLEVRFEHSRPDGWGEHERLFGAPVQFGRRTNAIAFRRSDLDTRMPSCDPYLLSVVSAFLHSRVTQDQDPTDFVQVVRNEIKMQLGSAVPSVAQIASILGLTSQEFQKRLKRSGLSFNHILRAARRELALHYLEDPDMPLTDIAYNLGYSELSAFSRAFRSWSGMSPQRYRRT